MTMWRAILERLLPVEFRIARLEQAAGKAYDAMYEAQAHNAKDLYEDAMLCLHQAAQLAEHAHRTKRAAELKARAEHIRNVYNHQFRYVGR